MIKIHKEGRTIVIITSLALVGLNFLAALFLQDSLYYTITMLSVILLILLFRFFRIPKRRFVKDDRLIISPADGKVVTIERTRVDEFPGETRIQVSVFMSIHDVHMNFYPIDGEITMTRYDPGKYLVARHPKSSELNERFSTIIANKNTILLVRQIAGYVARRIKCYAEEGMQVQQSQELGFIKFGSRLDLFIPQEAEILVALNETVTGGVTPIARIK